MGFGDIPLLSMLKSRLGYLSQRETLIAQNVANADTPGYAPKDLKPFTLPDGKAAGGMALAQPTRTNAAHLAGFTGAAAASEWKTVVGADSESTMDGNKVVLEDQMSKMTQARMDYEAAIGFYQKSLEMLRIASRAPGRN